MRAIPKLGLGYRFLDVLLIPFMFIANKCRLERPQETHFWHCIFWEIDLKQELCVFIPGKYEVIPRLSPMRHLPILGTGWEKYIVIQPSDYLGDWFVGWEIMDSEIKNQINLLKLKCGEPVRVLVSKGCTSFFALDSQGTQIKVQKIGEGKLGEKKFSKVRQF